MSSTEEENKIFNHLREYINTHENFSTKTWDEYNSDLYSFSDSILSVLETGGYLKFVPAKNHNGYFFDRIFVRLKKIEPDITYEDILEDILDNNIANYYFQKTKKKGYACMYQILINEYDPHDIYGKVIDKILKDHPEYVTGVFCVDPEIKFRFNIGVGRPELIDKAADAMYTYMQKLIKSTNACGYENAYTHPSLISLIYNTLKKHKFYIS